MSRSPEAQAISLERLRPVSVSLALLLALFPFFVQHPHISPWTISRAPESLNSAGDHRKWNVTVGR